MLKKIISDSLIASGANKIAVGVYVFGSYLQSDHYNDIDILLVVNACGVDDYKISIKFRGISKEKFKQKYDVNLDVVILTKEEEKQTNFSVKEPSCLIWPG
ncbi:MAG TPA: hypothetical protein VNC84_07160 [Gammaproteobacteria bacterium]|jgi:predicted nucleotidyltransferase|nr:hypothetical protein [Gammaproteobacteria bacterium]